jgi:hypothetical protein
MLVRNVDAGVLGFLKRVSRSDAVPIGVTGEVL